MAEQQPRKSSIGMNSILFFGFGIAAGILLAFSGVSFLQDGAALIATVFLAALLVILLLGVILYSARRLIWSRLFGFAEVQIEELATPLASVAERAIAGDPAGATSAARDLVALALARYSWVTTRRWIIASLTALIAAMAALAGTALLFQQNQLIEVQSGLLTEQNGRIAEQTLLLAQDVQLAEASRNAALAVEITQIAAELGAELEKAYADFEAATGQAAGNAINVLFADTINRALVLRITSVSRATKPYRFLDLTLDALTDDEKMQMAVQRRRADLPNTYARLAQRYDWTDLRTDTPLIDRPASPERGQLLMVLLAAGIYDLETFNQAGLDLSFAHLQGADIFLLTSQYGQMRNADFSGSTLVEVDLGGANLVGFRCGRCVVRKSSFAEIGPEQARAPYTPAMTPISTRANGADFRRSVITDTRFVRTQLLAANFDGALLTSPDFSAASLALSTFRGATLLAPIWTGAELKNVDFDGAVLFGTDVLADLSTATDFQPQLYRADPITRDEVMKNPLVYEHLSGEDIDRLTGGAPAHRLIRVQPFEDGLPP